MCWGHINVSSPQHVGHAAWLQSCPVKAQRPHFTQCQHLHLTGKAKLCICAHVRMWDGVTKGMSSRSWVHVAVGTNARGLWRPWFTSLLPQLPSPRHPESSTVSNRSSETDTVHFQALTSAPRLNSRKYSSQGPHHPLCKTKELYLSLPTLEC